MHSFLLSLVEFNIVVAALVIVFVPEIIYAALCLAFVCINVALFYLLLHADFLAAAQVLIYVGAVNVLIVFGIMLVNPPLAVQANEWPLSRSLAGVLSLVLFMTLFKIISELRTSFMPSLNNFVVHIAAIGQTLLKNFLIPFELLSIILLVALIGAIGLARKEEIISR